MLSTDYRRMAYELQLHYEGFPDDIIERARDKMQFERERLMNIQDPSYLDTFEKFINFSENEDDQTYREIKRLEQKLQKDQEAELNKRNTKQQEKLASQSIQILNQGLPSSLGHDQSNLQH